MKIIAVLFAALALNGCAASHADTSDLLTGTYLFRSQGFENGTPFFEVGTITYDATQPRYQVDSTYNAGGASRIIHTTGTYELHGNAGQAASAGDHADFYVSPDRSLIYAVGTDNHGTWLIEAHKIQ